MWNEHSLPRHKLANNGFQRKRAGSVGIYYYSFFDYALKLSDGLLHVLCTLPRRLLSCRQRLRHDVMPSDRHCDRVWPSGDYSTELAYQHTRSLRQWLVFLSCFSIGWLLS